MGGRIKAIMGVSAVCLLLNGCGGGGDGGGGGGGTISMVGTKITAGWNFTCAVTASGGAKCWGSGFNGQLGDGISPESSTPVNVAGLGSGVRAIDAGSEHACALTTAGGVKCWGNNDNYGLGNGNGGLGDETYQGSTTPVAVVGLNSGVAAIAAGGNHTCAVTLTGGVKCWGDNFMPTPIDVAGLDSGVTEIATWDYEICALLTTGGVKCGANSSTPPSDVEGLTSGVAAIGDGCAVTTTGGVKCWSWGTSATDVPELKSGVAAVAIGGGHNCALTTEGGVKCWGSNAYGQLGDGSTTYQTAPVDVVGLSSGVAEIAAGDYHTCALMTTGGIKCWGTNTHGALGDGTTTQRLTPVDVVGF
jgi:alpha-tubulin suppressor-like RCC1 family protein